MPLLWNQAAPLGRPYEVLLVRAAEMGLGTVAAEAPKLGPQECSDDARPGLEASGMSTQKARGTRREHAAIDDLERMGYTVMRSAASESPIDICALGPSNIKFIQVKSRESGVRPGELEMALEALRDFPRLPGVSYEVWTYRKYEGRWALAVIPA